MHNDDAMVGRLLTRRELVALLGMSGAAAMADPLYEADGVFGTAGRS